ncbi:redoxin domain-containing protein [Parasphingorhabdus sp. DH2-15]|uniref:redoxin domain-containing protein n=1 Tax=Parasphingorhabdus sp. DH2-15 TaxID=3444112 RepID=UPI003F6855E5
MSRKFAVALALGASAIVATGFSVPLVAAQKTGQQAANFTLTDANGKPVSLSQFRGKTVVLEWHNPGCPFVQKHYDSGNMQRTQAAARKQGVVWLTINSGAKGKQGDITAKQARTLVAQQKARSSHYLFDRTGKVGKLYAARTTPHMYIINAKGILVYQGGIDSIPSAKVDDIKKARNHVTGALNEIAAGKAVSVKRSRPYGCSVKYAS